MAAIHGEDECDAIQDGSVMEISAGVEHCILFVYGGNNNNLDHQLMSPDQCGWEDSSKSSGHCLRTPTAELWDISLLEEIFVANIITMERSNLMTNSVLM